MEPHFFYFVVLPLGALIAILVSLVLYQARKEDGPQERELKKLEAMFRSGTIDQKTFERMRNRLKEEAIFAKELEDLYTLLHDKTIDQDAYVKLRELLEKSFRQRIDRLTGYA
jgi:hypothetical protein